jgi:hypothetical protein
VSVPIAKPTSIVLAAGVWAMALLNGSQSMQLMRLRVGAWVECEVGDSVQIAVTHPSIWDWANALPGFTGPAVCIGRHLALKTGEVELKMLVGGNVHSGALCPSAVCLATDSTTAPTRIDVPVKYLTHFANALAASSGGTIRVLHYRPGQAEGTAEAYTVSAATLNGGLCRLSIAIVAGSPVLTVTGSEGTDSSRLTLPESANDDAYQARFMHDADGTVFA